jgi:hypothetical protein
MAAALICDDDGLISDQAGTSGVARLHAVLGHDAMKSTYCAIQQAEAWGVITRPRKPAGALLLVLSKLEPGRCGTCGEPGTHLGYRRAKAGQDPVCQKCQKTIHRADRGWRALALQTWAAAKSAKLSDGAALYRVHATTHIRLYGATDRELKDGEPPKPALVPWMVDNGLLDRVWLTYGARSRGRDLDLETSRSKVEVPEDWFEG